MRVLVTGDDKGIAEWAFLKFGYYTLNPVLSVGIVEDHKMVGAAFFHAHNGPDVEISYYGPRTMTLDIVRGLARIAVDHLGVSRVTARTHKSNKAMTRGIKKVGFEYEGIRRCGYGEQDAVMFGLYGRKLARLAGRTMQ